MHPNRQFEGLIGTPYELSSGMATFLSGGLAAELFWLAAMPADSIKVCLGFAHSRIPLMLSSESNDGGLVRKKIVGGIVC